MHSPPPSSSLVRTRRLSQNTRSSSPAESVDSQVSLTSLSIEPDAELEKKIRRCSDRMTECIYGLANEPVLGCYRVYEHISKTTSQLTNRDKQLRELHNQLTGGLFDMEYSIVSVRKMAESVAQFQAGHQSLKDALFYKQQLDYEMQRKSKTNETKANF